MNMVFSKKRFDEIIRENGTVFIDRMVFTMDYLPEIYKYRDKQLDKMATYSKNLNEELAPHHMMLTGSFATGKTTSIKKFFKELKDYYGDKVEYVYISCQFQETEYKVLKKIYYKLKGGIRVPNGLSTSTIHNRIMKKLQKENKILLIALDDYNYIKTNKELNKLLYKLLRAHEQYDNVKISVFLITNNEDFFAFNPDIATVFDPVIVNFYPYSLPQIYDILKQRCQAGFIKGTVTKDILMKVADYTYNMGDLREGIHLLALAGEKAEIKGLSIITEDCLEL